MTEAYRRGFMGKFAELGVPLRVADGMLKQAASWEKALLRYAKRAGLSRKETYRLWLSVLNRSNPDLAKKLPKTLQHVARERQLGPWTNGKSRKIYSKMQKEIAAARDKVFGYIEPRSVPFSEVAKGRSGDFIFKGSDLTSLSEALERSNSKNLWWSHNPAVSMGYTPNSEAGTLHVLPISGEFQRKVHSRFTPHIASSKEEDISRAVADKMQRAGASAAGSAPDYEFVSNADDIPNFLGKTEEWFTFPSRNSVSKKYGDIPVYHGFDVNPNDPYFSQRLFFNDESVRDGLLQVLRDSAPQRRIVSLSPLPSFSRRRRGMFPYAAVTDVLHDPIIRRSTLGPAGFRRFW